MTSPAPAPVPCIPGDPSGTSCLAGLLLGVRCCADGRCALCRRDHDRMRRQGYTEAEVLQRAARSRSRLRSRCPACGFPPPLPLQEIPPLPRLDRSGQALGGAPACRYCGTTLLHSRRRYCDLACWNAAVSRARCEERAARRPRRRHPETASSAPSTAPDLREPDVG